MSYGRHIGVGRVSVGLMVDLQTVATPPCRRLTVFKGWILTFGDDCVAREWGEWL